MLSQGGLQIFNCRLQLTGADLRDPQGSLLSYLLQMGYRLGVVALRQQRITEKLMRRGKIRRQFHRALERSDGGAVVLVFHVGLAKVDEAFGQLRFQLSYFLELCNGNLEMPLLVSLGARLQMSQCLG